MDKAAPVATLHSPVKAAVHRIEGILGKTLGGAFLLTCLGGWAVWGFDLSHDMISPWPAFGAPVMNLICGMAGILLLVKPQWVHRLAALVFVTAGVYFWGCYHFAAAVPNDNSLYTIAANGQFMPLVYILAYVALNRGAALISSALYMSFVATYLFHYWNPPGLPLPPPNDRNGHTWFVLLLTHPCYIVALHYISSLKGRLRQSEVDAQVAKERFLAMLSHEIRSPLQAMIGSIDLLALKVQSPAERRAVSRLQLAAAQLDTHLRDVTEFTRLENPSWELHAEELDLASLIQDVSETYQAQARAKGLRLFVQIEAADAEAMRHICTDARRVRQILANLITNAIKYTQQGDVTIKATCSREQQQFQLDVIDTGIGIPRSDFERIFEPYIRLEDERTAEAEGSGLGLAVVRKLVERLGGQLELDSHLDVGSRFRVTLPWSALPD